MVFSEKSYQKTTTLAPYKDIMNSSGISAGAVPMIKCEDTSAGVDGEGGGGAGGYNLSVNVNLAAPVGSLLAAEQGGNTPRTPEILNSLIAMTSPLEQYNYPDKNTDAGFKVLNFFYLPGLLNVYTRSTRRFMK